LLYDAGDLVPFRIHTLLIGDIVAALRLPSIHPIGIRTAGPARDESRSGADGGPDPRVAGGGADGGTKASPDQRAYGGTEGSVLIDGSAGWRTDLLPGPLPTGPLIDLELLEWLARSR
jgi:hypothetical protein